MFFLVKFDLVLLQLRGPRHFWVVLVFPDFSLLKGAYVDRFAGYQRHNNRGLEGQGIPSEAQPPQIP